MNKEEFLEISRAYFKSIGFQILKKSKFYYDTEDITLLVWFQHSNFSETYYVDYYFRIKKLHPEVKNITDNVWDTIGGRLIYSATKGFNIEYQLYNKDEYLKDLSKLSDLQIVPIMQDGVCYIKKLATNCERYGAWILFRENDRQKILSI